MTPHPLIEYVAGDDWEIEATLLDENGNPYDLTNYYTLKWALIDNQRNHLLDESHVIVTVIDATAGKVSIIAPSTVTTSVPGGLYSDALRLAISGETGTLLMGPVNVIGDPWGVAVAPAKAKPGTSVVPLRKQA